MDKLPVGVPAVVTKQQCPLPGLLPGTKILIRYRSPSRGVIAVEFGGSVLALQTRDVRGVRVVWRQK